MAGLEAEVEGGDRDLTDRSLGSQLWEGCAGLVDGAPRTTAARIIVNAKIVPMPVNAAK